MEKNKVSLAYDAGFAHGYATGIGWGLVSGFVIAFIAFISTVKSSA